MFVLSQGFRYTSLTQQRLWIALSLGGIPVRGWLEQILRQEIAAAAAAADTIPCFESNFANLQAFKVGTDLRERLFVNSLMQQQQ